MSSSEISSERRWLSSIRTSRRRGSARRPVESSVKSGIRPGRTPLFEEDSTGRRREPRRRDVQLDERQRASLEISDDDIDVPSFLKD